MIVEIIPVHTILDTLYIVRAGDGVVLVDGGDPHTISKIKRGFENNAITPGEIKLIILTHGHWDHIGCASEVKAWTGAKLFLHQDDIHMIHETPPVQPPGFTGWGKVLITMIKLATRNTHITPFEVDITAREEELPLADYGIPGRVVHTPGHSYGSISVVLENGEALVGDLGFNMFPLRLTPGLPIFGDDMQVVKNSWRKLRDLGVHTVYPAHGKSFPAEVVYRVL